MEVKVVQDKVNIIKDGYTVFVDGEKKYRALSEVLHGARLWLYNVNDTDNALMYIHGVLKTFDADIAYDIHVGDKMYYFRTESMTDLHYRAEVEGDIYDIYGHSGRKYSIFKNDEQIAWWNQKKFTLLMDDTYTITANADVDVPLIAMFCMIFDFHTFEEGGKFLNMNPEKIAPTARKFDKNWQPKQ